MSSEHVFIVGGSTGIGLATANLLLQGGYKVTIAGRDEKKLKSASEALGSNLATVICDAAKPSEIENAFAAQRKGFDHLILALGSSKGGGPFTSVLLEDVKQGFSEKVFPHFGCAQAAMPFLPKSGSITFVSAVSANWAVPETAGLASANAAIEALIPILAMELKPLRVNAVSPGVIDTPWWDFLSLDQKKQAFSDYAAKTPVGRVGRAEDVAQVIALLIANTFMTGQTIICDGGLRLSA